MRASSGADYSAMAGGTEGVTSSAGQNAAGSGRGRTAYYKVVVWRGVVVSLREGGEGGSRRGDGQKSSSDVGGWARGGGEHREEKKLAVAARSVKDESRASVRADEAGAASVGSLRRCRSGSGRRPRATSGVRSLFFEDGSPGLVVGAARRRQKGGAQKRRDKINIQASLDGH